MRFFASTVSVLRHSSVPSGFEGLTTQSWFDMPLSKRRTQRRYLENALSSSKPVSLVVSLAEHRKRRDQTAQALEKTGGPGRTRTCNQTVMSAAPCRKIRVKLAFRQQNRAYSCAFVHGVSVGFPVGNEHPQPSARHRHNPAKHVLLGSASLPGVLTNNCAQAIAASVI